MACRTTRASSNSVRSKLSRFSLTPILRRDIEKALVADEVEFARMSGGQVSLDQEQFAPFFVAGDRAALSRALSNIIGNALRYGNVAHVTVQGPLLLALSSFPAGSNPNPSVSSNGIE